MPEVAAMIPTMILLGVVLGRWWWAALIAAGVGWPVLLFANGTIDVTQLPDAAFLAMLNAAVGMSVAQGILRIYRRLRHRPA